MSILRGVLVFLTALHLCACAACHPAPTALPSPAPSATASASPTLQPTRIPSAAPTAPEVRASLLPTPTATLRPSPTATRTPTPWGVPVGRGTCDEKKFRSVALNQEMPFYLYLPPGYSTTQAQRRYPTLYLLSGLGGSYKEWKEYGVCAVMDQHIAARQVQPMIVVMPSGNDNPAGGIGSYWINHFPNPPSDGKRWGDYVWQDVVNYVDANYRTLPRRESRAIGGLSAGGQGALIHALMHPEIFGVVGAHSPSFRTADGSIPYFGDVAYYAQYDPMRLVKNTAAARQLTIWIDYGASDLQWGPAGDEFHALLAALDIPHAWHVFYGAHDPPYWMTHVPDYLQWYAAQLTGQ